MSNEINEAKGDLDVSVVIVDDDDASSPEETVQSQRGGRANDLPVLDQDSEPEEQRKESAKEMRAWMTLLATVAASVTYQAGLNPPGGFWQADDSQGHIAGNPVLRDKHQLRYLMFYYFNATAFVTSLSMIVVLVSKRFFAKATACINVISLIGAFTAGSALNNSSTIFVVIISFVAFTGIVYFGKVMAKICSCLCYWVLFMAPPLFWLAKKGWLPMTAHMKQRVERAKRKAKSGKTQCYCCS